MASAKGSCGRGYKSSQETERATCLLRIMKLCLSVLESSGPQTALCSLQRPLQMRSPSTALWRAPLASGGRSVPRWTVSPSASHCLSRRALAGTTLPLRWASSRGRATSMLSGTSGRAAALAAAAAVAAVLEFWHATARTCGRASCARQRFAARPPARGSPHEKGPRLAAP